MQWWWGGKSIVAVEKKKKKRRFPPLPLPLVPHRDHCHHPGNGLCVCSYTCMDACSCVCVRVCVCAPIQSTAAATGLLPLVVILDTHIRTARSVLTVYVREAHIAFAYNTCEQQTRWHQLIGFVIRPFKTLPNVLALFVLHRVYYNILDTSGTIA
jgi:hypothetical protein